METGRRGDGCRPGGDWGWLLQTRGQVDMTTGQQEGVWAIGTSLTRRKVRARRIEMDAGPLAPLDETGPCQGLDTRLDEDEDSI